MYYRPYNTGRNRKRILWYHALLVGMIPILIYAASINVVTRAPDGYKSSINKVQEIAQSDDPGSRETLEEIGIYLSAEELGINISDYMKGKTDRIETVNPDDELHEYYDVVNNEFSDNDYKVLGFVKMLDNILAGLGIICLIWFIIMFVYHIRDSYDTKSNLRKLFLISLPVQAGIQVISVVSVAVKPVRNAILNRAIGVTFSEEDILPQIFEKSLPVHMAVYIFIGSVILTLILAYIIWVTTKPRNTFNERRYFR